MLYFDETTVEHRVLKNFTVQHFAALSGNTSVLDRLEEIDGVDMNALSEKGTSPFHIAVYGGHIDAVQWFIDRADKIEELVNLPNEEGFVPLHWAAQNGYKEVIDLLLEHGARPNEKAYEGWLPIHTAAQRGRSDVVERLLRAGIPVDEPGPNGSTALLLAAQNEHVQLIETLASAKGDPPNPNLANEDSWTPFTATIASRDIASEDAQVGCVEALLQLGADLEKPNSHGYSPLMLSVINGRSRIAELLLKRGAMPDKGTEEGQTPLHEAALRGHSEIARMLLGYRADPAPRNKRGDTPGLVAARRGHLDILELLIARDAGIIEAQGAQLLTVLLLDDQEVDYRRSLIADGLMNRLAMPPWITLVRDDSDRLIGLERLEEATLKGVIAEHLRELPAENWSIPPLIDGDWEVLDRDEAIEMLAEALGALPATFGIGLTHFDAVRRRRLPFYDDGMLLEGRAMRGEVCAGYLTFLKHGLGITFLNGTSPPIHEINSKLPVHLDEPETAEDYLHFFCAAVHGEHGAFTILDSPSRLLWLDGVSEEVITRAESLAFAPRQIEDEDSSDDSWHFNALVRYNNAIFDARFHIDRSGMIKMPEDQARASNLSLRAEVFEEGLRTLRDLPSEEEPEFKPRSNEHSEPGSS